MKKSLLIGFSVLSIACVSCNEQANSPKENNEKKQEELTKPNKQDLVDEITKMEQELLLADQQSSAILLNDLVITYKSFARQFSSDSLAPEYLFRTADLQIGRGNYEDAVSLFKKIYDRYDDYIKKPESLFMTAFVYDTYMDQKGAAKEYYEKVIKDYPDHRFATDAKASIEALHMTDEEWMQKILKENKDKKKNN